MEPTKFRGKTCSNISIFLNCFSVFPIRRERALSCCNPVARSKRSRGRSPTPDDLSSAERNCKPGAIL